jgi:ubiquinone/menaquinone biosynthesis C-methylase UbiE
MPPIFHQLFPGGEIASEIAKYHPEIDIQSPSWTSKNFADLREAINKAYESISAILEEKIRELEQAEKGKIDRHLQQQYIKQEGKAEKLAKRIIEYRARTHKDIIDRIVQNDAIVAFSNKLSSAEPEDEEGKKRANMTKLHSYLMGNYAAQIIDIGLRAGLLRAIYDARATGINDATLAKQLGFAPIYVQWWCKAAYAFELLDCNEAASYKLAPHMEDLLLEPDDLDFLGDEFLLSTALFQEFRDFPGYLYTGQIRSRSEVDPRVRKFYQNLAEDDAAIITDLILPEAPEVLKRLEGGEESKILDIGTGAGAALIHYAQCFPNAHVEGMDIDLPTVLLAQRKIADEASDYAKRIEVRLGDANQLEVEDTYDLITINLVLHEVGIKYEEVLKGVYRSLRQDGAVVICEFYTDDTVAAHRNAPYQQWLSLYLHEVLLGSSMISSKELKQRLQDVGFRPDRTRIIDHPINGYLMVLAVK